jgi:hypothetical protein
MAMNRRTLSTLVATGAAAALTSTLATAAPPAMTAKARNVGLVHGLFADGTCRTDVIARSQAADLNVTSVQNPLTTLPEAVASAQRVLVRQDGPTVLAGHSFSGMKPRDGRHDRAVSSSPTPEPGRSVRAGASLGVARVVRPRRKIIAGG